MAEHPDTPSPKRKLFRRPLLWIGLIIGILLVIAVSIQAIATRHSQDNANVLVIITNSGSTNTPGATVTINKDGSATISYDRDNDPRFNKYVDKTFPRGTFDVSQLAHILVQIGNVETIPEHHCIKSVSFGSVTTITYQGKTSGDMSCRSNEDPQIYQDLANQVMAIYMQAVKDTSRT